MIKRLVLIINMLLLASAFSWSADKTLSIVTKSYQQIEVKDKSGHARLDKDGKPVIRWIKATKVVPGDIIKYVDTITNDTNQTLSNIEVKNPLNSNLLLVADTMGVSHIRSSDSNLTDENTTTKYHEPVLDIKYSIDGGKTYKKSSKLWIKEPSGKKDWLSQKIIMGSNL